MALGHLHAPQAVSRSTVRYCGTPLKYSFSESSHQKSISVVTLQNAGQVDVQLLPLKPRLDLLERTGSLDALLHHSFYQSFDRNAYLHITLTDEQEIPDAIGKLRTIYPNIMKLDYCNTRTARQAALSSLKPMEKRTPMELFADFYEMQNNQAPSDTQKEIIQELITQIWGREQ